MEEIFNAAAANAKHDPARSPRRPTALFTAPANVHAASSSAWTSRFARCRNQVDILVGDVTKVPNPRSGKEMLAMTDMAVPVTMKDYGVFAATQIAGAAQGVADPEAHAENAAGGGRSSACACTASRFRR